MPEDQPNAIKRLMKQGVRRLFNVSPLRFALMFMSVAVVVSVMIVLTIDLLWDGRLNAELEFAGIVTPALDSLFLIFFVNAMLNEVREEIRQREATEEEVLRINESLSESEEKFRSISTSAQDAIIILDENGIISFWNTAAEKIFGYSADEAIGKDMHILCAPERFHQAYHAASAHFRTTGHGAAVGKTLELVAIRKEGDEFPIEISLSAVRHKDHWIAIGIVRDISERKQAEQDARNHVEELIRTNSELQVLNAKLEQAQSQVFQSEKMASIGMLAAGVAHEINNPVGFIKSNMNSMGRYVEHLLRVVNAYEKAETSLPEHSASFAELHQMEDQIDFEYERQEILPLISESCQGLERVTRIVQDLKDFSHMDSQDKWKIDDIHHGIESTLNVIWNQLKYTCEVKKDYGDLPLVECVLSQLNQVFMNLLLNAGQAIEKKGTITIRTGSEDDMVWIDIADTGKGIAPENLDRIFNPFFRALL